MKTRSKVRAGLAVALVSMPAAPGAQWTTPWAYSGVQGPEHWGDLDPAYGACKAGKEQSPIDIQNAIASELPPIRFVGRRGPVRMINNGYTAVRVDYAPGNGNVLMVGDARYELTQFHFHHPSEEYLHGQPYAMGLHLMYQASGGTVAAVAVLLKAGRANAAIEPLWEHMSAVPGPAQEPAGLSLNPAGLLPHDTAYYTYAGSLTAPPCTEGVTWFVLKTPVDVSAEQIQAFAKLYPHDVRPVQPLEGRLVKTSR